MKLWAVIVLTLAVVLAAAVYEMNQQKIPVTIQEDDPGWNCQTMGNHICGPQGE